MELGKQQYDVIMNMPLKRFYSYLKWKVELEEEKKRIIKEEEEKQKSMSKRKK